MPDNRNRKRSMQIKFFADEKETDPCFFVNVMRFHFAISQYN